MEVLENIAVLYTFLSPILPSVQDWHRTIKFYRGEDDQEGEAQAKAHDKYNSESKSEEEDNSQRKEDLEPQPKENRCKKLQFSQSHLSDTEKEEENIQIEDDNTSIIPRLSNEEDGILPQTLAVKPKIKKNNKKV